jgi:hypothetical protein
MHVPVRDLDPACRLELVDEEVYRYGRNELSISGCGQSHFWTIELETLNPL